MPQAQTSSSALWPAPDRTARLTADTTALKDAVVVSASMPTPQRRWPSTSTSTYAAASADSLADSVCCE